MKVTLQRPAASFATQRSYVSWCSAIIISAVLSIVPCRAEDWPTYEHDNRRSGVTREKLSLPLRQAWVRRSAQRPRPAWSRPAKWDAYASIKGLQAMRNYDPAFFVTSVGDAIWFGSAVDDAVHCLDARTGAERWAFITGGAVRVAPTWHDGNVYFGSDDGCAYCVNAATGKLVWKHKAADDDRLIPSNGKLISLWPCRTGVLVQDGTAYFAASLLPWKQSWLCAVNAKTGLEAGPGLFQRTFTRMTLEAPMLASDTSLYVLQGRGEPVLFRLSNGDHVETISRGYSGGVYAVLTQDSQLVFGRGGRQGELALHKGAARDRMATVKGADRIVISSSNAYLQLGSELAALDWNRFSNLHRRRATLLDRQSQLRNKLRQIDARTQADDAKRITDEIKSLQNQANDVSDAVAQCVRWRAPYPQPHSLVLAADLLFAGGNDRVQAVATSDGRELWNAPVDGRAYGLAIANNRLFVSTDTGAIHCFSENAESTNGATD